MAGLILTAAAEKTLVTNAVQAAAGVKGALNGVFCGLVTADFISAPNRVLADFTEASYTAYARQAVTWGVPFGQADGSYLVLGAAPLLYQIGSADSPVTVYGYVLTSLATAGVLVAMEKFDAPLELLNADRGLGLLLEFDVGRPADWGTARVVF
jgi:hypothetical protein